MIEVNNSTTSRIDEEFLKKIAKKVLKKEKKDNLSLSIALVGQERIRELNKRYRGKNRVTDVLAFPDYNSPATFTSPVSSRKGQGLGEIVICFREIQKNTKRFGSNLKEELATCLIHGILHLLGYNHEKSEIAAKKMKEKQQYYLKN